jgi:glycosyltransferase involved in cell wall biosynthesis
MSLNITALIISHGFQRDYEIGFVNGIALAGVDVTLIGGDDTYDSRLHPRVRNLIFYRRNYKNTNRKFRQKLIDLGLYHFRLLAYIATHRFDTIHIIGGFYYSHVLYGIIEPLFMRLFANPVVETVHNLLPHDRHTRWNYWVHRMIYSVPNILVVHTEKMKSGLVERFGVAQEKIVVMQHGVNDLLEPEVPVSELKHQPRNTSKVRMLCFGAVRRYKGHDLLIDAMNLLDDGFELLIAGVSRDGEYQAELEEMVSRNSNREQIQWRLGFVPDADVAKLLHEADVVVLPYRHIDQSGVLFKALGLGCPVIATDVGSFRDYITAETGIIAEAISAEALRDACLTFRSRRSQYDRDTIRSFAEQFLWSRTVKATLPAYY